MKVVFISFFHAFYFSPPNSVLSMKFAAASELVVDDCGLWVKIKMDIAFV
jgi:hypothetical protein